jgi:FtsH-binding integral membrane protein
VPLLHSSDPLRKNDVLASNLLFAALAIFLGEQLLWAYLAHWYLETSPLPNPFGKTWFVTPLVLALLAGAFFYAIRRGMFRAKMVVALVFAYLAYTGTHVQYGYVAGVAFYDLLGYPLLVLLKDLLAPAALVLMFKKPRMVAPSGT